MHEQLKRQYDKRARAWDRFRALLEVDEPSAEQRAEMDRLEAEIDETTQDIARIERGLKLSDKLESVREAVPSGLSGPAREVVEDDEHRYEQAFAKYLRRGMLGLAESERELLASGKMAADEIRALGIAPDTAGGYLVPPAFEVRLVETMKFYGAMIDLVEVVTTASGADIEWPTVDDTGNKGAILAENTAVTEQDVVFGTKTLGVFMYTSKLIRVSYQLLNDSAFDVEGFLERKMGERLGRIWNEHITTGTGTAQPQGFVTGGTAVVAAGAGVAVSYDDLVEVQHAIDPAYRNERARWVMHDGFLRLIRKIKDTAGNPIWQPGLQTGQPSVLLGAPYSINNDMPAPALSAKSAAYGDFAAGYTARRVQGIGNLVLRERYAEFLQVGFLSFGRMGGAATDPAAYRVYQFAAA